MANPAPAGVSRRMQREFIRLDFMPPARAACVPELAVAKAVLRAHFRAFCRSAPRLLPVWAGCVPAAESRIATGAGLEGSPLLTVSP